MNRPLVGHVNPERLWRSLMDLARIGATPKGGVRRLALTDLDREGRDLVSGWCREAGLMISVDRIGNIFARRAGTDRKSTRLNSSHGGISRMPSSA